MKLAYARVKRDISEEDIKLLLGGIPKTFSEKNSEYLKSVTSRKNLKSVYHSLMGIRLLLELIPKITDLPSIIRGEYGKPGFSENIGMDFSISHTDGLVICALCEGDVGADCESEFQRDPMHMAERFFAAPELEYVRNASDRKAAFTEIWTKKEAYVKRLGTGLAAPLKSFDVTGGEIYTETFKIEEYTISVCSEKKYFPVELKECGADLQY